MDANELKSFGVEEDLGVLVDNKLKFDQHINETINKSNALVGMKTHYISFKTSDTMVPLFLNINKTCFGVWKCCMVPEPQEACPTY